MTSIISILNECINTLLHCSNKSCEDAYVKLLEDDQLLISIFNAYHELDSNKYQYYKNVMILLISSHYYEYQISYIKRLMLYGVNPKDGFIDDLTIEILAYLSDTNLDYRLLIERFKSDRDFGLELLNCYAWYDKYNSPVMAECCEQAIFNDSLILEQMRKINPLYGLYLLEEKKKISREEYILFYIHDVYDVACDEYAYNKAIYEEQEDIDLKHKIDTFIAEMAKHDIDVDVDYSDYESRKSSKVVKELLDRSVRSIYPSNWKDAIQYFIYNTIYYAQVHDSLIVKEYLDHYSDLLDFGDILDIYQANPSGIVDEFFENDEFSDFVIFIYSNCVVEANGLKIDESKIDQENPKIKKIKRFNPFNDQKY